MSTLEKVFMRKTDRHDEESKTKPIKSNVQRKSIKEAQSGTIKKLMTNPYINKRKALY